MNGLNSSQHQGAVTHTCDAASARLPYVRPENRSTDREP
jgi:hypothetical protein